MKILLGKPVLKFANSTGSGTPASWTTIDTPREGTTTLNTTDGESLEAKEEGGEVVEHIDTADKYSLEFEVFVKKGVALPFSDTDGVIVGEFAFRVESALDSNAPSFQIDRAVISASVQYAPNDSLRVKYTVTALKPTDNSKTIKYITGATASAVTVKDSDDSSAETITTSAKAMSAGEVEVVFTGTNMDAAVAAQLKVGDNIINLTKDNASSTTTSAKFTGVSSAGDLRKVILDGFTVRELPASA